MNRCMVHEKYIDLYLKYDRIHTGRTSIHKKNESFCLFVISKRGRRETFKGEGQKRTFIN